jgi:hypothetical protein
MEGSLAPRFVADAMLGKLARWLRMLGYDTLYVQDADAEIAQIARSQRRVLLTRDIDLSRRRGIQTLYVESQMLTEQFRQITAAFGVADLDLKPRCMACNEVLEPLSQAEARQVVPLYVASVFETFQRCPNCARVYWEGTHWDDIQRRLWALEPDRLH